MWLNCERKIRQRHRRRSESTSFVNQSWTFALNQFNMKSSHWPWKLSLLSWTDWVSLRPNAPSVGVRPARQFRTLKSNFNHRQRWQAQWNISIYRFKSEIEYEEGELIPRTEPPSSRRTVTLQWSGWMVWSGWAFSEFETMMVSPHLTDRWCPNRGTSAAHSVAPIYLQAEKDNLWSVPCLQSDSSQNDRCPVARHFPQIMSVILCDITPQPTSNKIRLVLFPKRSSDNMQSQGTSPSPGITGLGQSQTYLSRLDFFVRLSRGQKISLMA
jgi:hypothetical protein